MGHLTITFLIICRFFHFKSSQSCLPTCLQGSIFTPLRYQPARFIFIFCEHNKFSCLDFLFFLLFLGCLICFKTKGRPGSNVFPPTHPILTVWGVHFNEDRPPCGSHPRSLQEKASNAEPPPPGGTRPGEDGLRLRRWARPWVRTESKGPSGEILPELVLPLKALIRILACLLAHMGISGLRVSPLRLLPAGPSAQGTARHTRTRARAARTRGRSRSSLLLWPLLCVRWH